MDTRPRVRVVGEGDRADTVWNWLLDSGAHPVTGGGDVGGVVLASATTEAPPEDLPVLDATTATRQEVASFARRLAGRSAHVFDDHGSPQGWPRGSY
jgi:hypothetical protein